MEREPSEPFKAGDFIEVRSSTSKATDDFGVIRGTALDSRGRTGLAGFRVELPDKQKLQFSLNNVTVKTLFRADIARKGV